MKNLFHQSTYPTIFLLLILVFISGKIFGISYTFSPSSGTYTPNAGTNIWTSGDDNYSSAINIGFTFNFGGCTPTTFTQVKVSTNGWMTLGTWATGSQPSNNMAFTSYGTLLAPLWDDLAIGSGGNVNYKTTGAVGSRVFTVEWLNMKWYWAASSPGISFQVKLYEADGKIEYIYRQESGSLSSPSASIGINSGNSGDYYSLNGTGTNPGVLYGTAINNLSTKPATGQIYSWELPGTMTYISSTVTQASTADVYTGTSNQEIISVPVTITGGCTPFNLTQMTINMNGTTSLSDVTNIDVYYTGTSSSFAVTTLYGSTAPASGNLTVNGTQALQNGINYLWIVYDISPTAVVGNLLDACCTQITMDGGVGNKTPVTTDPAGNRLIVITPESFARWVELGWAKCVIESSDGGIVWAGNTTNSYSSGNSDQYIIKTNTDLSTIYWTCATGTSTSSETVEDIVETSDGFITVGWSNLSGGAAGYNILVTKINLSGNLVWSRTIGSASSDRGYGITPTSDGNIAICGEEGSGSDGYFAKIDNTTGAIITEKVISYPSGVVRFYDIIQTLDGGFLIGGEVSSDFYLVKLTSTYNLSWGGKWGGGSTDVINFVLENGANDYTVGGYTYSYGAGSNDGYIMRFTVSGGVPTVTWVEAVGSADGNRFNDGQLTADGGYIMSGLTTRLGDPLNNEAFFTKINSSGANVFIKSIGTTTSSEDEEGYGVTVMADGSYALAGLHNNAIGPNFYLMKISNSGFNCAVVQDNGGITTLAPPSFTAGGSISAPFGFTTATPSLTSNTGGVIAPDGCGTLPVELSSFSGTNKGSINVLDWTTSSETNNDYFNVESSVNGINWKTIGKMNGVGNSNSIQHYSWIDNDPAFPVTYYRLKQTDYDGKFEYSTIIEITKENFTNFEITDLFPDPVTETLSFRYNGNNNNLNVFIYNELGQLMKKFEYKEVQNGDNYSIHLNPLPKGVYFIKFLQDKLQYTTKIIK